LVAAVPLKKFELVESPVADPSDLPTDGWIPAQVPGGVHEALVGAGRLEHPYFAENELDSQWVAERTWWYRLSFTRSEVDAPGSRTRLILQGLDTVCSVFLNGSHLGDHANMFRPAEWDVTGLLGESNTLHIRFSPPLADLATLTDSEPGSSVTSQLVKGWRRKATYSWGWDFAPNLPSVGIWLPAELVTTAGPTVTGRHIRTISISPDHSRAEVAVAVEIDRRDATGDLTATLTLESPDSGDDTPTILRLDLPVGSVRSEGTVEVVNPRLWWTNDLGSQPLYTATLTLRDESGAVKDTTVDRIGIRTIELDRSAVEGGDGRLFRFVVNGVPIFARGANWVPPSMMIASVTDSHLESLVETARRGAMNMIRIWGGGVYERPAFYEACDAAGVLVWQDFMFACIDYPSEDPTLAAEVAAEAEFQVRRLRNHPCMALWCGNNEVQGIHSMVHGNVDPGNWGYRFFHELLPAAVAEQSPGALYWPGSPWGEPEVADINGTRDGDRHAWEVWHGLDLGAGGPSKFATRGEAVHFERYRYDRGRFISEFGIHASPEAATLERWTVPGSLGLHSAAFDHRNKDNPKNKGDHLMDRETGLPADFDEYVELSMVCQAEGLKYGIEHYRRQQPLTSGTLLWQFNDPWPGFSWSIVDFDAVPKAGYYMVARAYAPVIASFCRGDDASLELWLCNSTGGTVEGELLVEVVTYGGDSILREEITVSANAASATMVWAAPAHLVEPGPDRVALVSSTTELVPPNRMFFGRLRDQLFGEHRVQLAEVKDHRVSGGPVEVEVISTGYNYFTRLVGVPQPGTVIDHNYIDMRDGETATFTLTGLGADADLSALRVLSYQGSSL
jgi:beta-mannosidase